MEQSTGVRELQKERGMKRLSAIDSVQEELLEREQLSRDLKEVRVQIVLLSLGGQPQAERTASVKALKQEDCEQDGEGGGPRCQVSWAIVRNSEIF